MGSRPPRLKPALAWGAAGRSPVAEMERSRSIPDLWDPDPGDAGAAGGRPPDAVPGGRKAGVKVGSVAELVSKLKVEAGAL